MRPTASRTSQLAHVGMIALCAWLAACSSSDPDSSQGGLEQGGSGGSTEHGGSGAAGHAGSGGSTATGGSGGAGSNASGSGGSHSGGSGAAGSGTTAGSGAAGSSAAGDGGTDAGTDAGMIDETSCEMNSDCGFGEIDHEILKKSDCECLFGCAYLPLNQTTLMRRRMQFEMFCDSNTDGQGNPCPIDDCVPMPNPVCKDQVCGAQDGPPES